MAELTRILTVVASRLPDTLRTRLAPLFAGDNLERLAEGLRRFLDEPREDRRPPPYLPEENTPSPSAAFRLFAPALHAWQQADRKNTTAVVDRFTDAVQTAELPVLLAVLGMRTTPGSVTDARAIPVDASVRRAAATQPVDAQNELSVAARALAKHADRGDPMWGRLRGPPSSQNTTALHAVDHIQAEATWWNVFEHFQHGLVYEARIASGHGARWSHDGRTFIGFVDPFDQEKRPDMTSQSAPPQSPAEDFPPLPDRLDRTVVEQRYAEGQRDFQGVDLTGVNLANLDLRGIDLTGASLRRAKLFRTNLEQANLTDADVRGVYLVGTLLSNAKARRANFEGCRMEKVEWTNLDLQGADLGSTNLSDAVLTGCTLTAVNLRAADLTNARLSDAAMYGVKTEDATCSGLTAQNCRLSNGRLNNTDFNKTSFVACKFETADLAGSRFNQATFERCNFADAELANVDLSHALFKKTFLSRSKLTGANLESARFEEADFTQASLTGCNLNRAVLQKANLTQTDLSRANLSHADLCGAVLDRADLSSADVVETIVDGDTRFEATKTSGVDFGTNWSLRRRVLDSAHDVTIRQFRNKFPILGFFWWALLGCGKRPYLLLFWAVVAVFLFAGLMAWQPGSFDFGVKDPTFLDHLQHSLAVFVTLDLAVDKGTDSFGRIVMLVQMLLSYLTLGFMASLFSNIFPSSPE